MIVNKNLDEIFDGDFNSFSEENQLNLCKEYFPIGTFVDLDTTVMGSETFHDNTITAKVIGYKAVTRSLNKFDNYCLLLDKEFYRNNLPGQNYVHPSLLLHNLKYFREKQIDKLL